MTLPSSLGWSLIRGAEDPVLGWYSPAFGQKVPATDVIGVGSAGHGLAAADAPRLLNLAWSRCPLGVSKARQLNLRRYRPGCCLPRTTRAVTRPR